MSKEKKKSLTETLSVTAKEVSKTGRGDFEQLVGELRGDIQRITVDFNEKLQQLDVVDAHKENAKIRYQRSLDGGLEEAMAECLREIREQNVRGQELKTELAGFPTVVKELYERQDKIFAAARESQSKAENDLRAAEKVLKATEQREKSCYSVLSQINDLNKSVEDIVRGYKKEKETSEAEIKTPRSNKEGFWLEVEDPFAQGTKRIYEKLKGVTELNLPCLLSFKDKDKGPVDEAGLQKKFEESEELKSEFVDVRSYIEFKSKVVVQALESYLLRAAGGGDRRREFAARVALRRCK